MRILFCLFFSLAILLGGCSRDHKDSDLTQRKEGSRRSGKTPTGPRWDPTSWPHERPGAVPADPAIKYGHLSNGFAYAILENNEPRDQVCFRLMVRSGSLWEQGPVTAAEIKAVDSGRLVWPGDERGALHFLEHVSFFGGEHFNWELESGLSGTGNALVETLQREGMSFGAHTNAYTDFGEIVYMFNAPKNDPKFLETLMGALSDFAGGLLIKPEAVEKERGIVLSEKRQRQNARYYGRTAEVDFLFRGTRAGCRIPIGSEHVIRTISPEGLRGLYARLYRPDNLALSVVGAVNVAEMEAKIEAFFGDLKRPSEPLPKLNIGPAPYSDKLRVGFHREKEHKDISVSIYQIYPDSPHLDTVASREHDWRLSLASAMLNERFSQKVKEENTPLLGAGAGIGVSFQDFVSYSQLEVVSDSKNWEAALAVGEQELRRALTHGFTQEEFQRVCKSLLRSAQEAVEASATRDSGFLASRLIDSAKSSQGVQSPQQELEAVTAFLQAVKLSEVLADFKKEFSTPASWIFMVGNPDLAEGLVEQHITQAYKRSQKVSVDPWVEPSVAAWAYGDWGPSGIVVKREHIADLDVTQITFENNVRLNLKPTDFDACNVVLRATVGSGFLELPGSDPSLETLFNGAFTPGGLETHSVDDLQRLFPDKSIGLWASVGDDSFNFAGGTTKTDLQLELQLLCAYLMAPGYRPESLRLFHKGQDMFYENFYSNMGCVAGARIQEALHSEDPRFALPSREAVFSLDLNDLKNWVKGPLTSGYMEVTLVGDFPLEETVALCAATLGALPKRDVIPPAYTERRKVFFPKTCKPEVIPVETRIQNASVHICFPGVDAWNADRHGLGLLMEVVEDRLRTVLRESMGATYGVWACSDQSVAFPGYGSLSISTQVDPLQVERVTQRVQAEIMRILSEGITQDQLDRARNPVLAKVKEGRRDNGYWGAYLESSHLHPEFFDWWRNLESNINAVNVETLNALATQYLEWSKALVFWVEPELRSADLIFEQPAA